MANFSPKNFRKTQHVRSISFPARSHPATIKAEEELSKLKSLMTFSSLKLDGILSGLMGLSELYNSVEKVLQLPLTQKALRRNQPPEWINQVLEDSVKHMDVCSGTRDLITVLKDSLQNIQSSIRRRGKTGMESDVSNFQQLRKRVMMKETVKIRFLSDQNASEDDDQDELQSAVMRVLKDTSLMTLFMFESVLSYVSGTTVGKKKKKMGKWSLVCKVVKREGGDHSLSELDEMEMGLKKLMFCGDKIKDCGMKCMREKLEALNLGMEDLEDGLDRILRCLIRKRVSLLNVLSC